MRLKPALSLWSYVFCNFGPMVIFLIVWFSIYSVLWIQSMDPAQKIKQKYFPKIEGQEKMFYKFWIFYQQKHPISYILSQIEMSSIV